MESCRLLVRVASLIPKVATLLVIHILHYFFLQISMHMMLFLGNISRQIIGCVQLKYANVKK